MPDAEDRYKDLLRTIAAHLAAWRSTEELTIADVAAEVGLSRERTEQALLAKDWEPEIRDLAKVEIATDADVFVTLRNQDFETYA